MINIVFVAVLVISLLCAKSEGFHMLLRKNTKRCFVEDLSPGTHVHIHYYSKTMAATHSSFIFQLFGPSGAELDHRTVGDARSMLFFQADADEGGVFEFCFQGVPGPMMMNIDLEIDVDHELKSDREILETKDRLDRINLEMESLKTKLDAIHKEHNYIKQREKRFRSTSGSTSSRVFYYSMIQILVLICTSVWQLMNLKNYFKSKKIS